MSGFSAGFDSVAAGAAGAFAAGAGWAVCTTAALTAAGLESVASALVAGTGKTVSISSFWKSNTATCCVLPSSVRVKSPFFRSSTALPLLSFTLTSTITRVVFDVKVTGPCAGRTGTVITAASPSASAFLIMLLYPSLIAGGGGGGGAGAAPGPGRPAGRGALGA